MIESIKNQKEVAKKCDSNKTFKIRTALEASSHSRTISSVTREFEELKSKN